VFLPPQMRRDPGPGMQTHPRPDAVHITALSAHAQHPKLKFQSCHEAAHITSHTAPQVERTQLCT
jgi:hypothetical protein